MTKHDQREHTQAKSQDATRRLQTIMAAVDVIVAGANRINRARLNVEGATANQLATLEAALESYPEPVTEEVWKKELQKPVRDHLESRYKSTNSRDVTLHMIKITTMGLTLAKSDSGFTPSEVSKTNIKKYYQEVRLKLQNSTDPRTGMPRLPPRRNSVRKSRVLTGETLYWLIGSRRNRDDRPVVLVLATDHNLEILQMHAHDQQDSYDSFAYVVAKSEPLTPVSTLKAREPEQVNATVEASTVSSARAGHLSAG